MNATVEPDADDLAILQIQPVKALAERVKADSSVDL